MTHIIGKSGIPVGTLACAAVASLWLTVGTQAASAATAIPSQDAWQSSIARAPLSREGCFAATYPSTVWTEVACTQAPPHRYGPARGLSGQTVGNGNDYALVSAGTISWSSGTFPSISGLTSEKDGTANTYSLQLNSNFSGSSPTCNGATNPSACSGWQQFVFAEGGTGALFMQYWLINYGSRCPSGWIAYSGDCYRNSKTVSVPAQRILRLGGLRLTGQSVAGGLDTIILTTATHAYSVTGHDNVVGLSGFWNAAEFNVIGNGDASQANFNKGTSITVNVSVDDGTTNVPNCQPNAGTTGETNNLTLGSCTATGGARPSIQFTESN
jgi:hypothetical protein